MRQFPQPVYKAAVVPDHGTTLLVSHDNRCVTKVLQMAKRRPKPVWPAEMAGTYPEFLATMKKESDRGCLLVGLSERDEGLGTVLKIVLSEGGSGDDAEWLLDQMPGDRPLANLAIRTRIARCLGLVDNETRRVIDTPR